MGFSPQMTHQQKKQSDALFAGGSFHVPLKPLFRFSVSFQRFDSLGVGRFLRVPCFREGNPRLSEDAEDNLPQVDLVGG